MSARAVASSSHVASDSSAFLGIHGNKEEQLAAKNRDIDRAGIWNLLPADTQESLRDPGRGRFISWLGHGVTEGKAAIILLLTPEECTAIIRCMGTGEHQRGVMSASRTSELYVGREQTTRHLIADSALAECLLQRIRSCSVPDACGPATSEPGEAQRAGRMPLLSRMTFGPDVVSVNERIRLVTTGVGGGHGKHADISETSEDGLRVSRLTFQCYLNPESYQGGHFQLYPTGSSAPVDIPVQAGCAVVFVQEDPELLHGGGRIYGGEAKRAIRGNLDVPAAPAG